MRPGLDLNRFEGWLAREHPHLLAGGRLQARLLTGGLSNLSYAVTGGREPWVLRRPPLGHVLQTAHDMAREHRVLHALGDSAVPVPTVRLLHDDENGSAGVGTPFYLMDLVQGRTFAQRVDNVGVRAESLAELGRELGSVLARLHTIDPDAVGLADFGRPHGFLQRQVARWRKQLDHSRSRDVDALDRLMTAVAEHIPEGDGASIIHGDFRLDNTLIVLEEDVPRVSAVLDWEMSTLGDPLTDLGLFGVYWELHRIDETSGSPLASAIDPSVGYIAFDEIVDYYSEERRIAVPELSWYRAFASFKLAVILEGIHYRYTQGQTVGPGFDRVGAIVPGLAERGLELLDRKG